MHRVALRNTVRAAAVAATPKVRFFPCKNDVVWAHAHFARRRPLSALLPLLLAPMRLRRLVRARRAAHVALEVF